MNNTNNNNNKIKKLFYYNKITLTPPSLFLEEKLCSFKSPRVLGLGDTSTYCTGGYTR